VPTWTSTLRLTRDSVVVGVCMAALVMPATSVAAGGTPMPAPDDPPGGFTASAASTPSAPTTRLAPKRSAESAQAIPTPDAPLVVAAAPTIATTKQVASGTASTPTPDSSPAGATPSIGRRPVVAAVTPSRTVRPEPHPAAKPATKPVGSGKARGTTKVAAKRHAPPPRPPASRPRDAVRIGLPVGVLALHHPDDGLSGALLVTAAILLAAAACGSTVLGVAARSATRQA
jgi:hypothetical protein